MSILEPGQSIKPVVSLQQAKNLVQVHFGVQAGNIKELNSYDDKNFYIQDDAETKFVFKVLNSLESQKTEHVEAEHEILFHLSRQGIKCPVPQKTVEGGFFAVVKVPPEDVENGNQAIGCDTDKNKSTHLIRLFSFIEGQLLCEVPLSGKLFYRTGAYIGHIDNILREHKHYPALVQHNTVWMLNKVTELEKFLYVIQDSSEKINLVKSVLSAYKSNIEPFLQTLEKGIIHADYNEQNILVQQCEDGDFDVCGIIDFADLQVSPYAFELAISICYVSLESLRNGGVDDPLESAGHFIAGYSKHRRVPDLELQLMRTLVACRLCQSLVLGAYTFSQDVGNEYLLITAVRGWNFLDILWNKTTDQQMIKTCKQFLNCEKQ